MSASDSTTSQRSCRVGLEDGVGLQTGFQSKERLWCERRLPELAGQEWPFASGDRVRGSATPQHCREIGELRRERLSYDWDPAVLLNGFAPADSVATVT